MGTRNLTKVIDAEGITRVAQYGQWDGYPEYTGKRILEFISEYRMLEKIERSLVKTRFITTAESDELYKPYTDEQGLMTMDQSSDFATMFPSLTRDTGCDILKVLVYSGNDIPLQDESDFEQDDLFCEAVYTIDFQTREFSSKWNGINVSLSFDDELPTAENYLEMFKNELTNA
jgi:hypothetical protein